MQQYDLILNGLIFGARVDVVAGNVYTLRYRWLRAW
jgi:hypothetical protein